MIDTIENENTKKPFDRSGLDTIVYDTIKDMRPKDLMYFIVDASIRRAMAAYFAKKRYPQTADQTRFTFSMVYCIEYDYMRIFSLLTSATPYTESDLDNDAASIVCTLALQKHGCTIHILRMLDSECLKYWLVVTTKDTGATIVLGNPGTDSTGRELVGVIRSSSLTKIDPDNVHLYLTEDDKPNVEKFVIDSGRVLRDSEDQ